MSSIFLAHSSKDNRFARRLAKDLRKRHIYVWIDEAEILVGDSLIAKLEEGIRTTEYLGVILSPNSIQSEWVRREVEIALNEEICGKRVKVLPILHEQCPIPPFLSGKLWADFSNPRAYSKGLETLMRRITPIRRGFLKLDSSALWTAKTLRFGLAFGVLIENSGHIDFSNHFLRRLCDESRKRATGGLILSDGYWGDMITMAVLETAADFASDEDRRAFLMQDTKKIAKPIFDFCSKVNENIIQYVAKIAVRSHILKECEDSVAINEETLKEIIETLKYGDLSADGHISGKEDIRPYFIRRLVEESRIRLILHDNERIEFYHLVGLLAYLLFELNGWIEDMERVVEDAE